LLLSCAAGTAVSGQALASTAQLVYNENKNENKS
jgi:hypothetical protein